MPTQQDIVDEPKPVANRRETLLGIFLTFGIVAFIAVGLRLYARHKLGKRYGWDDALTVLSLISITLGSAFLCAATFHGLGDHFIFMTLEQMSQYLLRFYMANATYSLSTALLKLSLLCQYLRIFDKGPIRLAIWTLIAICFAWGFVTTFMAFFPCFPVKAYWDWTLTNAKCYAYGSREEKPFVDVYVAHGVTNMVFDLAIIVLPAPVIFRRAMTKREKFAALGLGSLGLFVVGTCAWKLGEIIRTRATFYPYPDPSWRSPILVILAALEVDIGIIAVSCPVFWPMIEDAMFGITMVQEVEITTERMSRLHSLEDSDAKSRTSEHGSETALANGKQNYYSEELALEPVGLGQSETTIKGRQASHTSWLDTN